VSIRNVVCRRQAHTMLLHLIGAEQLRPQRRVISEISTRWDACAQVQPDQTGPDPEPIFEKIRVSHLPRWTHAMLPTAHRAIKITPSGNTPW
jgi:hypothetical protein